MSLNTVLKCSVAVIWVCRVVTAKMTFVRTPQTHVIRHCAVDDLRSASYSSYIHMYAWLPCSITGAASVATFPRHLVVDYGVPAGEASTAAAHSQAVRGWGTASLCISVVVKLGAANLAHWLQRLASFAGILALEALVYVILIRNLTGFLKTRFPEEVTRNKNCL